MTKSFGFDCVILIFGLIVRYFEENNDEKFVKQPQKISFVFI